MHEQIDRVIEFRAVREISDPQRPFVGVIAPSSLHHVMLKPDILVKVVLRRNCLEIL
jgi:hypothetical protein